MNLDISKYCKKAVVFGTGKMACALLGELLYESGFKTVFIVRSSEKVASINYHQGYFVGVAGETQRWVRVRGCSALSLNDTEAVAEEVAGSDIVFTAIGIDNIPAIAPLIAEGVWRRLERKIQPLNVIASENLPGTGAYLRHQIVGAASLEKSILLDNYVGFSAALTHRIMTGGEIIDGMLHFTVDTPGDLIIDSRGLLAPLPHIAHTHVTEHFDALFLEKLSTINLAQAVAAYIGHLHGLKYVHEAALHPDISPIVQAAVGEAVKAFQAEFPNLAQMIAYDAKQALTRITDPGLGDTIERICRGPLRKLGAQERLIGPSLLAVKHNLPHANLVKTISSALNYYEENDVQSKTLSYMIHNESLDKVLTEVCGLLPHNLLAQNIKTCWAEMACSSASVEAHHEYDNELLINDILHDTIEDYGENLDSVTLEHISDDLSDELKKSRISSFLSVLINKKIYDRLSRLHGHTQ